MTDTELLKEWRTRRDAETFTSITSRYAAIVFATCRRILGNEADAEDVTQECFETLVRTRNPPREHLGAWLHQVATNRSIDRIKAASRRRLREAKFVEDARTSTSIEWNDVYDYVDEAISGLPAELRIPVVMRFLEGKSQRAIAKALGVPRRTVRDRIQKGLEFIGKALGEKGVSLSAGMLAALFTASIAEAATVPVALTAALGKLSIAQSSGALAIPSGSTVGLLAGGLLMKKVIVAVVAVIVIAGALVLRQYLEEPAAKPDSNMKPPPLPAKIQAKVDALTKPAGDESQASNMPVLLAEALPVEEPKLEDDSLRPASVSGLIRNEQKNAVPNATLTLLVGDGVGLEEPAEARYSAQTDRDGKYHIESVTVFGDARLTASATGYRTQQTVSGAWAFSSLTLRQIEPDTDYTVDFALGPVAAVIAGRVVDSSRVPIAGARVRAVDQVFNGNRDDGQMANLTDNEGRFSIDLPLDSLCALDVRKNGYAFGHFQNIQANSENLELVLRKGGTIAGRVIAKSGNPVAGARIAVQGEGRGPGQPPGEAWDCSFYETVITDEQGQYRCDGLSDAFTYRVELPYELPGIPMERTTSRSLSDFVLAQQMRVWISCRRLHRDEDNAIDMKVAVAVRPEAVTYVDFVVDDQSLSSTVFYGRVTDPDTDRPVCPIIVSAEVERPASGDGVSYVGIIWSNITRPDGAYRIELAGLSQPMEITIGASYFTRYPTAKRSRNVTTLRVEPGEEHELNFTVPAGVTLPLRMVKRDGEPLEGISVERILSDSEGRLTLYGLEPNVTTQLNAKAEFDNTDVIVGITQPFIGKPGEVLPEQEVICDLSTGKVTGHFAVPEDIDFDVNEIAEGVANYDMVLMAKCYYDEPRGRIHTQMVEMDWDVGFTIGSVPPGVCSIHLFVAAEDPKYTWWAFIEDVEVLPDHVTDLGEIVPNPPELNPEQ